MHSREELAEELRELNAKWCEVPLRDDEVERIAASAWSYEARGLNFTAQPMCRISFEELDRLNTPDALWLFIHLQRVHGARSAHGVAFAISPRAMARSRAIKDMSERRIRAARAELIAADLLEEIYQGGAKRGDASLFQFRRQAAP